MSKFRFIGSLRGGCEQRRWRCTRLQRALAQLQNKLVDLIVLKLGDGIFKHEFLGQHAHRKAQVLAGVLCVEVLQSLLALAHVGTGRHWLTPMRKDVLEDAASQFVACTAGSSGMARLETFSTHRAALSSAIWRCRSRISARRATSEREMPSMAACSSAHAYRSGLTRTAITGCSCASFSDIGVAFRSYERCLSYKCVLRPAARHERAPDCPLHRAAALRRRVRFFAQVWMVRPFRHGVPSRATRYARCDACSANRGRPRTERRSAAESHLAQSSSASRVIAARRIFHLEAIRRAAETASRCW